MNTSRFLKSLLVWSLPFYMLVACGGEALNGETGSNEASNLWVFDQTDTINTVGTGMEFEDIVDRINAESGALVVFDIDNTLLITNDNKFGSDWWFSQASDDKALKLNITNSCLYNVLTPMFYSVFDTKPVFEGQSESLKELVEQRNKVVALTSRAFTDVIYSSTELELRENKFDFMGKDSATFSDGSVLFNDIMYTAGMNKGVVLLEYLEKHPYTKIYYFDDSMSKVVDVQKAFKGAGKSISLFHMEIAPKVPYSEKERRYMKDKLCIVIESVNSIGDTLCKCTNP